MIQSVGYPGIVLELDQAGNVSGQPRNFRVVNQHWGLTPLGDAPNDRSSHGSDNVNGLKDEVKEVKKENRELKEEVAKLKKDIKARDVDIEGKKQEIERKNKDIIQKDKEIERKNKDIIQKDKEIEGKKKDIIQKDKDIKDKSSLITQKDSVITQLNSTITGLNARVNQPQPNVTVDGYDAAGWKSRYLSAEQARSDASSRLASVRNTSSFFMGLIRGLEKYTGYEVVGDSANTPTSLYYIRKNGQNVYHDRLGIFSGEARSLH